MLFRSPENPSEEAVRAAYINAIKKHPPDHDPDAFERIRDAYAALRDPLLKMKQLLTLDLARGPFMPLLDGIPPSRKFTGPAPWLHILTKDRKK